MNSLKRFVDEIKMEDLDMIIKWLNRTLMLIAAIMFWLTWIGEAGEEAQALLVR